MKDARTHQAVRRHLTGFFDGHPCRETVWALGPARVELPDLTVLEFAPGPRCGLWVYATAGAWLARPDPRLEFVFVAPAADLRPVELLSMTAWYHRRHGLDTGHTLPLGEPLGVGSVCDHLLVSTPYPFGPDQEACPLPESRLHVLWLLPISAAERDYKKSDGLEALERQFEESRLEYWRADRPSVV